MTVLLIRLHFMILEEKKIEIKVKIFRNSYSNWEIIKLQSKELKIMKKPI